MVADEDFGFASLNLDDDICENKEKGFSILREACRFLNDFYVDTRYPAFWPVGRTKEEAEKAKKAAEEIKDFVKKKLK